jgi:hypothetical protein
VGAADELDLRTLLLGQLLRRLSNPLARGSAKRA